MDRKVIESLTDEQAAVVNAMVLQQSMVLRNALSVRITHGIEPFDGAELQDIRQKAKSHHAELSEWNECMGDRATPQLIALAESYGNQADDITEALNREGK